MKRKIPPNIGRIYDGVVFIKAPARISAAGRTILAVLMPMLSTLPLNSSGMVRCSMLKTGMSIKEIAVPVNIITII